MSSSFTKTQLFFKRLLSERISKPDIYKEFKNRFSLNLDYDLKDDDIEYLNQLINQTEYMYNINIRLSDTLTDVKILNKLLSNISLKKQFSYLNFFIKYLNDDLFSEFANFILNMSPYVTTFKLQMKYKDKNILEKRVQQILENLVKSKNNLNLYNLYFIDCSFNSNENANLLNELITKYKSKIRNIYLYTSSLYNNHFNIDITSLKNFEMSYFNLSQIKFLPKEKLNLSNNNISLDGIKIISDLLEDPKCTLKKLNLNNNFLGDDGCSILSNGLKKNKSLITLNLSHNNIIQKGILDIANSLNSKSEDGMFNASIRKINFSRNAITNVAIVDFCDILKNEKEERFIKINFQYNAINDLSINQFGEFIQKYPYQSFLSLTNRLSYSKKTSFLNYCKKLSNIKKIMFQNFQFDEELSKLFNDILLNNENIENIFVYYNSSISPENILKMVPGIEHNKNLIQIYFTQCKLGDEGAISLSNALFNNINIAQIHLDENRIGDEGAKAISEKLLGKVSLKKLILSHNLISSQGASYIGENLAEAQGIQCLLINSNRIGDEGCEFISKGLEKNKTLVQLNINNNQITNKGIICIAKAIIGKENFMTLSAADNKINDIDDELYKLLDWCKNVTLSSNPLSKEGIIKLFKGTENNRLFKEMRFKILDKDTKYNFKCPNSNLKDFDLSYNNLMNISLLKQVLDLKNISQLNIQSNDLGDENMSIISKYINDKKIPLKKLQLQSNDIGPEGSIAIAELLKNNNYLTSINLAGNPLGYEGVKIICNAMESFPNVLEELSLNYTICNNYCSKDIYNMLIKNNKLKIMSLVGNFFNNEGIDTILSALRINNHLEEISIGDNKTINDKGFQNLGSYLRFNKSLTSIEIKTSLLSDSFLNELSETLKENKKIINLNLVDNNFGYQSTMQFGLSIRKNDIINDIKMLLNKPLKDEQTLIKECNPHIFFN